MEEKRGTQGRRNLDLDIADPTNVQRELSLKHGAVVEVVWNSWILRHRYGRRRADHVEETKQQQVIGFLSLLSSILPLLSVLLPLVSCSSNCMRWSQMRSRRSGISKMETLVMMGLMRISLL